jgi:hypothetical protein
LLDDLWPDDSPEFDAIAEAWSTATIKAMLALTWDAFDALKSERFQGVDFSLPREQLERSLTDLHAQEINDRWARGYLQFPAFIPHHEAPEYHGRFSASSKPVAYDIAFVMRSNRRLRWSIEAKVVNHPGDLVAYLGDLQKYLSGKGAPYGTEAALAAYLKTGDAATLFTHLRKHLKTALKSRRGFAGRAHRTTRHNRPRAKLPQNTPTHFVCHHLVFALERP